MMQPRRLTLKFDQNPPHFPQNLKESAVVLSPENFSRAKNLLGREFDWILYDGRTGLNLDALAMAVGTLKAGGELVLWLDKNRQTDSDSRRWSGVEQGIATPNFDRHFYHLLEPFRKDILYAPPPECEAARNELPRRATNRQSAIINQILQQKSDLYIISAKRGRGKSALAGFLVKKLRETGRPTLRLTAPNKSAVKILQDFAGEALNFIAPDDLIRQINEDPNRFAEDWLFIDEAAMLPLPSLFQLVSAFRHIVITTTVHSYEGTGRGFLLKFLANLHRTFQHFQLTRPMRWREDDRLEPFIDELLLLECEDNLAQPPFSPQSAVKIRQVFQSEIVARIRDFYGLLTLAHYRTSPLDLRRLFDAPKQQFWLAEADSALLGGMWLVEEGLWDERLIRDICSGLRRPKGNLAAQKLAQQQNDPAFLTLNSLRISRIAVQPAWQRQGLGRRLVAHLLQNCAADFVSVSFGYTPELARFWQKCGFILVHLGESREASSGCYSAIALKGISVAGLALVQRAELDFKRNFSLGFHPLRAVFNFPPCWQYAPQDEVHLKNFAKTHRTLAATVPAIRRKLALLEASDYPVLADFCRREQADVVRWNGKKNWLAQCRREVKKMLNFC
ncbi:GNAT family N-acetyltransferase [Bisgaard Taxon 10/6]|uniref:GNAT family N-acetyltransferase n=1 Tax=Exercitatus varius TaxID=67857 RepID=UPI00294B2C07|nr:GNAT family N-acetyltransferase [Exercitatus varius]MDG2954412.1 GNAT family N-acetyltransferase [Exercitatus varius]